MIRPTRAQWRGAVAVLAGGAALVLASVSPAAIAPEPGDGDPRLQVVHYVPDEVVEVHGAVGFVTTIEFGEGERMQTVAVGAGLGWQITPDKRGDAVFVKPSAKHRTTNMTVITNLHRYDFLLMASSRDARDSGPAPVFDVRFIYPPPEVHETVVLKPAPAIELGPVLPKVANNRYSYQGSRELTPERVFDDGQLTYFQFFKDQDYPAIYLVGADHKESVMNFAVQQGYIVVDKVAPAFVLRRGSLETKIFNDGYKGLPVTEVSPRPRSKGPF